MKRKIHKKLTLPGLVNIFSDPDCSSKIEFNYYHLDIIQNELSEIYSYNQYDDKSTSFIHSNNEPISNDETFQWLYKLEKKFKNECNIDYLRKILYSLRGFSLENIFNDFKIYDYMIECIDILFSASVVGILFEEFQKMILYPNTEYEKLCLLCQILITIMTVIIEEINLDRKLMWKEQLLKIIETYNLIQSICESLLLIESNQYSTLYEKYLCTILSRSIIIQFGSFDSLKIMKNKCRESLGLPVKIYKYKVSQNNLIKFIKECQLRHFGYQTELCITDLTFGFPEPVVKSIEIMKKNLYTTSSDKQIENEMALEEYPFTVKPCSIVHESALILFMNCAGKWDNYLKSLMNILMKNVQHLSKKNLLFNFEEVNINQLHPNQFIIELEKNRRSECICKHVSTILLQLLNNFKISHVLMFEHMCISLLNLDFFNLIKNILDLEIQATYKICTNLKIYDYPWKVPFDKNFNVKNESFLNEKNGNFPMILFIVNMLKITVKLIKDKPGRLILFNKFNLSNQLKSLLNLGIETLNKSIYKILKHSYRYNSKQHNVKGDLFLMSNIFKTIHVSLNDDWMNTLTNNPLTSFNVSSPSLSPSPSSTFYQFQNVPNTNFNVSDDDNQRTSMKYEPEIKLQQLIDQFIKRNNNTNNLNKFDLNNKHPSLNITQFSSIEDFQNILNTSIEGLNQEELVFDEWVHAIPNDLLNYLIEREKYLSTY